MLCSLADALCRSMSHQQQQLQTIEVLIMPRQLKSDTERTKVYTIGSRQFLVNSPWPYVAGNCAPNVHHASHTWRNPVAS